jgi:hypothetical protein
MTSRQLAYNDRRAWCFCTLLLVCSAGSIEAQRVTLAGRVIDTNGRAISHANIVVGKQGRYLADDDGAFRISVARGMSQFEVRRLGFQPLSVKLGIQSDTVVDFMMTSLPQELAVNTVTSTLVDVLSQRRFYDRMRDADRGLITGYYVTPEDIEARRPFRISQMLEGVPGVRLLGTGGSNVIPVGTNDCAMSIYLDGARVKLGGDDPSNGSSGLSMQPGMASMELSE